jgi:hypothetical protein
MRIVDQRPEQALPSRQVPNPVHGLLIHPNVDELLQPAGRRQHPQGRIPGIHQSTGGLRDPPQHYRQGKITDDHLDGGQQCAQPALCRHDILRSGHQLRE